METPNVNQHHRLHIALLPYPGLSHITPMLAFSRSLSRHDDLQVSMIVTEEWSHLLSSSLPPSLLLRTIPNVIPSHQVLCSEFDAYVNAVSTKMEQPVENLIVKLEPRVDLIVSNYLLPWAPEIGRRVGIPVAAFFPQSATEFNALFQFARFDNGQETMDQLPGEVRKLMDNIPSVFPDRSSSDSYFLNTTRKFIRDIISWTFKSHALLISSVYDLEKPAIDALKSKMQSPVYPIGPLIHCSSQDETNYLPYIKWLDSQLTASVVYIALGSFIPVSKEQFSEIIFGLNLSGAPYLCVARENLEEIEQIVGERGLIVPWCDQIKVLNHPSIGGFLTHCGWSSISEAIYSSVPMITLPITFDQYPNSNLIVNDWKIGLKLREDKGEQIVTREKIEMVVRQMMNLDGEESKEIRNNIRGIMEKYHKALEDNGSANTSVSDFLQHVMSFVKDLQLR